MLSGASEALLERILGGIPGLSDVDVKGFRTYLQAMGKEGLEESLQQFFDTTILRNNILNENIDFKKLIKEVGESAAYGAVTAGILNIPSLGISELGKYDIEYSEGINNEEVNNKQFDNVDTEVLNLDDFLFNSDKNNDSNVNDIEVQSIDDLENTYNDGNSNEFTRKLEEMASSDVEISNLIDKFRSNYIEDEEILKLIPNLKKAADIFNNCNFGALGINFSNNQFSFVNDLLKNKNKLNINEALSEYALNIYDFDAKCEFYKKLYSTKDGKFLQTLNFSELSSIQDWCGSSYQSINSSLRNNSYMSNSYINDQIKNLDSLINKYGGLSENRILYRSSGVDCFSKTLEYNKLFDGVNLNDANSVYSVLKVLEGRSLSDKGYMATSATSSGKMDYMINFEIAAPAGTKGAYIGSLSQLSFEEEFLLARDSELLITEVSEPKDGKILVKCVVSNENNDIIALNNLNHDKENISNFSINSDSNDMQFNTDMRMIEEQKKYCLDIIEKRIKDEEAFFGQKLTLDDFKNTDEYHNIELLSKLQEEIKKIANK